MHNSEMIMNFKFLKVNSKQLFSGISVGKKSVLCFYCISLRLPVSLIKELHTNVVLVKVGAITKPLLKCFCNFTYNFTN